MRISIKGVDLIKEFEGLRLKAYLDTGGVPTIGYGTTVIDGKRVTMGLECTPEQAEGWIHGDVKSTEDTTSKLVEVEINQNQFDALVCFAYNVGTSALRSSTLLRYLNEGSYTLAAQEFPRWNKDNGKIIPGLVKRRAAEQKLFSTPSNDETELDIPEIVEAKFTYSSKKPYKRAKR